MFEMTVWSIPDWLASGEVLFRTLLGALLLLLLWEVATLLAVLIGWVNDEDPTWQGRRTAHRSERNVL